MTTPRFAVMTLALVAVASSPAQTTDAAAQTPAAAAPAANAAPAPPKDFWHSLKFWGLVDVYTDKNFNDPASENNSYRNFDTRANGVDLNFAKFAIEKEAAPVGFRFDVGAGRATKVIYGGVNEQGGKAFQYIEQAYLELKPAAFKGVQLDFGKYVTPFGAEVIESNNNWNYSRSLLFAWAIPYYHLGIRSTIPIGKSYSATAQVVNGWNNVKDNNSGKSVILGGTLTKAKFAWSHNYMVGPEKNNTNKGQRQLFDTTLTLTPNPKTSAYINFDIGNDKRILAGSDRWYGVAGAFRYQATGRFAFSPRLEWFKDRDGFSTGTPQALKEFTLTGEYKLGSGKYNSTFMSRVEYRHDWSDVPVFDQKAGQPWVKSQDTILVALMAWFEPKK